LEKLVQLTELDLSGCERLTELPGLEKLIQLKKLDLSRCEWLTELPGLEKLVQLTRLKLSGCSQLTELPGLEKLVQLTELELSGCRSLTALPSLDNLTQLTRLDLSGCGITALPESLRNLKSLRKLDLCYLSLKALPDWLPEIAEKFTLAFHFTNGKEKAIVSLEGTTVEGVDMSIFEQPYEMIVEWFEKRKQGQTHPLNEIKVVFLGDGEAGKSHTIARLINDGGEPDHAVFDGQSTPGIVIRNKEYDLGDRKIQVHYWDFGGQEIMHSMHRIFLTGRTMYVILLNARDDTQSDRAKYWLHNVKSFAPDAPVLLVLNKIDQNENASVDEPDLRGRYDKLTQVVRLSALKDSPEKFNDRFTKVLLEEIQKTGFLDAQWPISWTKVKERLENMTTHYIMGAAYQTICEGCQVADNQKNLLHWFNDLGVSFCCCDKDDYALEDYVILRPDWITNALYIILFNKLEGTRNGLIPHASIHRILRSAHNDPNIRCTLPNARYNGNDIQYVLGVMRKFSLSFPHGTDHEFIPMLCQQNSMVDIQYYHKDEDVLEFNMEFDYLPNNLLHRLMVERYSELDMATVWRTGAKFNFKELGYSAVVLIDGNTLRFFIRHTNPMHRRNTYLTMLKAHVDRIVAKMGLQPPTCQLIYKLDGKRDEFDYEDVKLNRELGDTTMTSKAHRKKIRIEDILNQSAPDGLDDEKKLLEAIRKSCLNIQAESDYYLKDGESGWGMEDKRNRRIRDDLQMLGYDVKDQTQRGLSGTGRGIGELDLLLCNDRKEPWTIIEALRVSSGTKTEWNKHLDKLVANYNYFGASCLYLLTYVDSDEDDFHRIWKGYQQHIPKINPGKFTYCATSLIILNAADDPQYVKTAKCQYDCGGRTTTAYHIFVRIPKQG
jgi:small GTP-binding protein